MVLNSNFFDQFSKTGKLHPVKDYASFAKSKCLIPALGYYGTYADLSMIVLAFLDSLRVCSDLPSFVMPLLTFLKDLTSSSYVKVIELYGSLLLFVIKKCFSTVTSCFDQVRNINLPFRAEGSDLKSVKNFLDQFKSVLKDKDAIIDSEFSSRISTFSSLLICLPFFRKNGIDSTWFGFSKIYDQALMKTFNKTHPLSVYDSILEGSIFILEKSINVIESGNIKSLYCDDDEIVSFEEDYNFLAYYFDRLDLIDNHDMTLDDYYRKCDALRERCSRLIGYSKHDKYQLNTLKTQYSFLGRCMYRASDKLKVMSEREPPLAIVLYGNPGIGKSALIDKLLTIMYQNAQYFGRTTSNYDVKMKYHYNHSDEYMSEFRVSHEICIVDDVDQFQDKILEQDGGGALKHTIDFINPVPYVTNQAELTNKGMIPFMCKYVIMTTNTFDAGVSKVFRDHGGAKRRFLFFDVSVKEEYRKPGQTQLGGDKDNPNNHDMHDFYPRRYESFGTHYNEKYWDKDLKEWSSQGCGKPMSLAEVAVFLRDEIQRKHYEQNDVAKKSVQDFISTPMCSQCHISQALCGCFGSEGSLARTINTTIDCFDFDFSPMKVCEFVILLPIYLSLSLIFSYHCSVIFDRMMDILPYISDVEYGVYFKYLPKTLQRYFVHRYWSNKLKLNTLYLKRDKYRNFVKYGIISLVTFIMSFRTIIGLYSCTKMTSEGGNIRKRKQENPWKITYKDVTRMKGIPSTTTIEQLKGLLEFNVCYLNIRIYNNTYEFFTRALGLYGNTIVLPAHNFIEHKCFDNFEIDIIRADVDKSIGPNRFKIKIDKRCIFYEEGLDQLFITHPALGTFRDIRHYFIPNFEGICPGTMMVRNEDGKIDYIQFEGLRQSVISYYCKEKNYKTLGFCAFLNKKTDKGFCGSPYLVNTLNGCFIAGIHIAGGFVREMPAGYCLPIELKHIISERFEAHSFDGISLNEYYNTVEDLELQPHVHVKDPISELNGLGFVYGTLKVPRIKLKSNVTHTIMCEDVLEHYGKLDVDYFSPATISSKVAAYNNLNKMVFKPNIDYSKLCYFEKNIVSWYERVIDRRNLDIPSGPYDLATGINGIDQCDYIDRLPVKTSGGFAHRGRKDRYLVLLDPVPEHEVNYDLNDNLTNEYNILLECYKNGRRGNVVWDFNFKDEPISANKVRNNKCRIFNSGPLAFMVLVRRYFLWCIPLFSGRFRHEFGMAIGANAFGSDWNVLYEHVTKHGKSRMIAGDYKSFDKRMSPELMSCAFNVLITIAKNRGWSDEDLRVMRGIATDICYPLSNCFGTLIEFFGSNPSGHPLTTPINGICNILYIMVAVYDVSIIMSKPQIDYSYFLDYVSILTYGDDNCMSSKLDYINHTTLSKALAKYGVGYTMADKTSESIPFIDISKVEFLKRSFRPNVNKKGSIAAPLNEDSIIKSLTVCTESKTITFKQQCAEIIDSACREYYQYGKKKFEEKRNFFLSIVKRHNLWPYLARNNLLTYDELYLMYDGDFEAQGSSLGFNYDMSIIVSSHILYNYGKPYDFTLYRLISHVALDHFGRMCMICDEIRDILIRTWGAYLGEHYERFDSSLEVIKNFSHIMDLDC